MKKRKLISLVCALSLVCAFAANGCVNGINDTESADDLPYSVYRSYAATAEAIGISPLSYENWLLSIKGEQGDNGIDGADGADGKSAYEIWLAAGNSGSEADFIDFLKGEKGEDGADGESAYEIWLAAGNSGSEADFIDFLKGENGENGADGKSAYEIWLAAGNSGTEADFIDFLKGEKGENGADGVSVIGAYINDETYLILQMSDGTEINAGYVGVPVSSEEPPEDEPAETYTVTFIAEGETVGSVTYKEGDEFIKEPQVPEKTGYTGEWEEYTLTTGDITVNAIYTKIAEETPDDSENSGDISASEELYVINIQSTGGLKLDGVAISLINSDGEVVLSRASSAGQVSFWITPVEYTVEIDASTLPKGYRLEDTTYTVGASGNYELTITIPSEIITEQEGEEKFYNVGDIAGDFTLTDYTGVTYSLSDILQDKKAVIINFWDPKSVEESNNQLSLLQDLYSEFYWDVEILGVYGNGYSNYYINSVMGSSELNITFPLAADSAGLMDSYQISELPSMVIIDRYGLITRLFSGAQTDFSQLYSILNEITADNYVQNIS